LEHRELDCSAFEELTHSLGGLRGTAPARVTRAVVVVVAVAGCLPERRSGQDQGPASRGAGGERSGRRWLHADDDCCDPRLREHRGVSNLPAWRPERAGAPGWRYSRWRAVRAGTRPLAAFAAACATGGTDRWAAVHRRAKLLCTWPPSSAVWTSLAPFF